MLGWAASWCCTACADEAEGSVVRSARLRGVPLVRKNHYGSRSGRGTRVAALFYSLIESAKLSDVEPHAYLREITLRAVRKPGIATLAREFKSAESLKKAIG